jgi:hypothetical protein
MKSELEKKLISRYPDFFRDVTKSPQETCMCWGVETGDGWYDIIDSLCGFLTDLRENRHYYLRLKDQYRDNKNHGSIDFNCPEIIFDQVKEKYGTLRVYWHFAGSEDYEDIKPKLEDPDELDRAIDRYMNIVDGVIDFCEYLSSKTCEVTGKPGKLYSKGWCVTLCKEEAIKRYGFDPDEEKDNEKVPKL